MDRHQSHHPLSKEFCFLDAVHSSYQAQSDRVEASYSQQMTRVKAFAEEVSAGVVDNNLYQAAESSRAPSVDPNCSYRATASKKKRRHISVFSKETDLSSSSSDTDDTQEPPKKAPALKNAMAVLDQTRVKPFKGPWSLRGKKSFLLLTRKKQQNTQDNSL